ncbi:hypothetical protein FACS189437_03830 [Bacteroidia bacterium]|nr:hypothetical protein FACS189437_03830 [Bacteroidia bacterium]
MDVMSENILKLLNMQPDFLADTVKKRRLGFGLCGYGAGAFAFTFFTNISSGCGIFSFIMQTLMYFILFVFTGILFAALTQMFLDLTAKTGNAPGLFALVGISEFAKLLLIAGAMISAAAGGGVVVNGMIFTFVFFFQIVLLIYLAAKAYGMTPGAVFLSMTLTIMPSLFAAVILICAGIAALIALIAGLA